MTRFHRVCEEPGGTWSCQRELEAIDDDATLDDALIHLFKLADEDAPAYVHAHWMDGRVAPTDDVESVT